MLARRGLFFLCLCLSAFFLKGCFVLRIFDFGPSIELDKYASWEITSFILGDKTYVAKNFKVKPMMRFDTEEQKIYGNTGCNVFFANYEWINDSAIEMRGSGMTRKMCPKDIGIFEQKLMEEFDGDFEIKSDGETLVLNGGNLVIYLKANQEKSEEKE